jgi:hypothetical protein
MLANGLDGQSQTRFRESEVRTDFALGYVINEVEALLFHVGVTHILSICFLNHLISPTMVQSE